MNEQIVDSLIMVIVGLVVMYSRFSVVAKIVDPQKKKRTDRILKISGPIILSCGVLLTIGNFVTSQDDLDKAVQKINEIVPVMVDETTRLDRASAGENRRLIYDLTLISLNGDEVEKSDWEKNVVPTIRANMLQKKEELSSLFAAGITVVSRYSGNDGVLIGEITLKPEDFIQSDVVPGN